MDADKLTAIVAKMRTLGVLEYTENGCTVRLGPPPGPAPREKTKDEIMAEIEEARRRHHETQFAACHVMPKLHVVK